MARWLVIGLYVVLGLAGAVYLAPSTAVGLDLETYRRAGEALWAGADPYAASVGLGPELQYRYPPLLALVIPIIGQPLIWYPLLAVSTGATIWLGYRIAGWPGLLPSVLLIGAWGQMLFNGNVQGAAVLLLAVAPLYRTSGPIALAVATMLKIHPAIGLVWFIGRRDWRGVLIYTVAAAVLLAIQAPWLDEFIAFYRTDAAALEVIPGMSLSVFGPVIWGVAIVVAVGAALVGAQGRLGWLLAVVAQLVVLPRVYLVNLALLMAAPIPPETPKPAKAASDEALPPGPPAPPG